MMQLSLSGRIIEIEYRASEMSVPDFLRFARGCGYDAVELRATQITLETTEEEASRFRQAADKMGLAVSCCAPPGVTGDEKGLDNLERFAPFAHSLGCDTLKIWNWEMGWMQSACDRAKAHGLNIITQVHTNGPFETIASCLETLAQLNRPNFGLQYDAANLLMAGENYGKESVKRLGSYIRQVSIQTLRPARADESNVMEYKGRRYGRYMPGDPEGLDYVSIFQGLKAIGFDGYVTVNEPKPALMDTEAFARGMREELRKLM